MRDEYDQNNLYEIIKNIKKIVKKLKNTSSLLNLASMVHSTKCVILNYRFMPNIKLFHSESNIEIYLCTQYMQKYRNSRGGQ